MRLSDTRQTCGRDLSHKPQKRNHSRISNHYVPIHSGHYQSSQWQLCGHCCRGLDSMIHQHHQLLLAIINIILVYYYFFFTLLACLFVYCVAQLHWTTVRKFAAFCCTPSKVNQDLNGFQLASSVCKKVTMGGTLKIWF